MRQTLYITIQKSRRWWSDQKFIAKRIGRLKPTKLNSDQRLIKLVVEIPDNAFDDQQLEACIIVPIEKIGRAADVNAEAPA